MSDLYLYHATDRKNLDSILTNGLLINPPSHAYKDFDCEGKIFLAFDANVAESYAEESDDSPDNIVILRINLSCLHEDCFDYDWNNRCAYTHEINSCVYLMIFLANAFRCVVHLMNQNKLFLILRALIYMKLSLEYLMKK